MKKDQKLFESGKYFLGCNGWASHAGTNMWHEWDEGVVEADFRRFAENGLRLLRVFPLWSDFQPIKIHYDYGMRIKDIRLGEKPLDDSPEGVTGVDPVMIERFSKLLDIAPAEINIENFNPERYSKANIGY